MVIAVAFLASLFALALFGLVILFQALEASLLIGQFADSFITIRYCSAFSSPVIISSTEKALSTPFWFVGSLSDFKDSCL